MESQCHRSITYLLELLVRLTTLGCWGCKSELPPCTHAWHRASGPLDSWFLEKLSRGRPLPHCPQRGMLFDCR